MSKGLALMVAAALLAVGLAALAADAPAPATETPVATEGAAPKPEAPAKAPPAEKAAGAVTGEITVRQIFIWGGTIGWIIVGLFIVAVGWVLLCLFRIRKGVLMPKRTVQQIEALFGQKKIREALEFCKKDGSVLARMIGAGLSEIRGGYAEMAQVMAEIGDEESIRCHQIVGMFSLLAAVGPLLGLLGTVWGMVLTFNTIASSPDAVAKPADMAYSIEMALITTVFGLIVAIPCVFFFTVFRNRVVNVMIEASTVAEDLMVRFKGLQPAAARPVAAPKAPAPAKPAVPPKPGEEPKPAEEPKEEKAEEKKEEKAEGEAKPAEAPEEPEAKPEAEEAAPSEPIEVTEEAIEEETEEGGDQKP